MSRKVEARDPDAVDRVIDVSWTGRLFALGCAVTGAYVAAASVAAIRSGQAAASWLLPLATGGLAAVLCVGVVSSSVPRYLPWRSVGQRTLAVVLLVLYAFVLLPAFGFLLGSLVFVTAVTIMYTPRRLSVGIGGTILVVALWVFFAYVADEPLPAGWLWR